jgi:acyl-CoA thioester hydrolase
MTASPTWPAPSPPPPLSPLSPLSPDSRFRWPARVYYEDTDAAGVVYYANYLRLFERCRTEWLRALGVDHRTLAERDGVQFVVVEASIAYHRPARLDDALVIEATVQALGRAYIVFALRVLRDDAVLTSGRVKIACVDVVRLRPARLPDRFLQALEAGSPGSTVPSPDPR